MDWAIGVWASSLLNAAYFLPISGAPVAARANPPGTYAARGWRETAWLLLLPPLATAIMTLAAGVFAQSPGSPLAWAKLIAEREYRTHPLGTPAALE
ncbi:MAG: hypothetical protein IPH54_05130 [Rhodoferax sp.]|nr:hypothetical protein [Rhodoferax sp.]